MTPPTKFRGTPIEDVYRAKFLATYRMQMAHPGFMQLVARIDELNEYIDELEQELARTKG